MYARIVLLFAFSALLWGCTSKNIRPLAYQKLDDLEPAQPIPNCQNDLLHVSSKHVLFRVPSEKENLFVKSLPYPDIVQETIKFPTSIDEIAQRLQNDPLVYAKSIGHTSVVFRIITSKGGINTHAVLKPKTNRLWGLRYRGELAAYRLAQALLLPNVPPVWTFRTKTWLLELVAGTPLTKYMAKQYVSPHTRQDEIFGVVIPWIEGYTEYPLEKPKQAAIWHGWLQGTLGIPSHQTTLAKEISNLLIFDYITGNFDRWSGENIAYDKNTGMLLFVDNDGAFLPRVDSLHAWRRVQNVKKLSKTLVACLRTITLEKLRIVFGEESPSHPLLPDRTIQLVYQRIQAVVQHADKLANIDPETYFFE